MKKLFGIKGFVATSVADFAHTFSIIEKSGFNPTAFSF